MFNFGDRPEAGPARSRDEEIADRRQILSKILSETAVPHEEFFLSAILNEIHHDTYTQEELGISDADLDRLKKTQESRREKCRKVLRAQEIYAELVAESRKFYFFPSRKKRVLRRKALELIHYLRQQHMTFRQCEIDKKVVEGFARR